MAMNEQQLDQFNQRLRANPAYRQFLQSIGVNPDAPMRLSDQQRKQVEAWVRRNVGDIGALQIDPAGNANQDEGWSKHKTWAIPAAIGVGTLGLGAAGVGPAAGLFGGGGAASGAGAASAGSLTEGLMSAVPASIASQGVSAGVPLGAMAAGAGTAAAPLGAMGLAGSAGSGLASAAKEFFTDPSNLAGLGTVIAGLASGRGNQQDTEQLERIQQITEAQMRRADPLHQAAVQLAFGRMPTNYRQGIDLKNIPLPG
jgi:hypothetical protein